MFKKIHDNLVENDEGFSVELIWRGFNITPISSLQNLSRADARAVEQVLIEKYGLMKNGGTLLNKVNSISPTNPRYQQAIQRGIELLTN